MGLKKIEVIRNWILNYVQSGMINTCMRYMKVERPAANIIYIATNLDKISIVQLAIGKLGLYKWMAYCIYFVFFA